MPLSAILSYLDNLSAVQAEAKMVLFDALLSAQATGEGMATAIARWTAAMGLDDAPSETANETMYAELPFHGIEVRHVA
jgi:hypothetical protein